MQGVTQHTLQSTSRVGLWLKIHWEEGEVSTKNMCGDGVGPGPAAAGKRWP